MPLPAGTRLGAYEILNLLGAGGMGEVYRAADPKLGRDVAIKVVTPEFARDPERLARFEREARVLASLNHPNIAAIYGLEESGGIHYLVLEFVPGKNLAGPLPLDEALAAARQIAVALEEAHEKGIVHRDLKPANVKVTPEGKVKVLDFGLAKALHGEAPAADSSASPTLSADPTRAGAILGTPPYMSPEQARGRKLDKRTDIWAFGCVLYEALSGRQAFGGESMPDVLSAVVSREPDWGRLPAGTPAGVHRLLRRCLEKDPARRLRDIGDAWMELDQEPIAPARAPSKRLILVASGVVLAALVASFYLGRRRGPQQPQVAGPLTRTVIELPANAPLALGSLMPQQSFDSPVVALSPDGRRLAYVGQSPSGNMLYLREMGALTVQPVAGTEGAIYAFFSPDSRWLGFLTSDKVKKVSLDGGVPSTLCDAVVPVSASWTRDDAIYFSEMEGGRISRVSAAGGGPTVVAPPFASKRKFSQILPDGKSALMTAWTRGISTDYADVVLLPLTTREPKVLIRSAYDARYVPPNYLLFGRSGNLFVVRFDPARREIEGEPFPVASGVSMESFFGQVHAAASENGLIAYVSGSDRAVGRLVWVDRQGRSEFLPPPARLYGVVDLSPNGERLAVHVADVTDYIWIYDLKRGEGRKLAASEHSGWPVWSPDNASIAFSRWQVQARRGVLTQPADGGSEARELLAPSKDPDPLMGAASWSPDGRVLALARSGTGSISRFLSLDGAEVRASITRSNVWAIDFSPDGRWVAYASDEPGRFEVFVQSYPDGKTVRQISADGGMEPVWCRCGELFWRSGNRWMSVAIRTQPELSWDPPRLAFQVDNFIDTPGRSYDVSPDGKRLLVVKRAEPDERSRIHLITNWKEQVSRP